MGDSGALQVVAQLGPIATGSAALVALAVGLATVVQRARVDRREQWWARTQWALDARTDADPRRAAAGEAALSYLSTSDLAGLDEVRLLAAIDGATVDSEVETADDGPEEDVHGGGAS